MPIPRLHVIGRKNAGKTTLVVELIERLTRQGLVVGSIKHTHHRHELDVPGKDSYRHRQAGAAPVAILSPGMTAVFRPNPTGVAADGYPWLDSVWDGCDLVLVEGDSQTSATKVEVWRDVVSDPPLATLDPSIKAVISDNAPSVHQAVWPRSGGDQLVHKILELVGLADAGKPTPR
jgi:molybdopterin-guanine dinucleotide biosynthesis protein B